MDLTSSIIGVIILLLCFIPFIIINQKKKGENKKTLNHLHQFAKDNGASITQSEISGKIALGIDEKAKKLFFLDKKDSPLIFEQIDLSLYKSCRLFNNSRNANYTGGSTRVIDKLELRFVPKTVNQPELGLEVYNVNEQPQITNELQYAEKWVDIINHSMK